MDILPDYLIIESLGTASGKSFYWARRKSDNTVVLIKQSTAMHLFDDEINKLKQECKTAELIGYKATLRLPDTQNGHCAIIYESCDGVFLNRLLETQSLSIDEKIHLFKVAAKSLNELQKKNIIHFGIRLDTTLLRNNNEETLFFSLGDTAILNEGETFFPGNHHYTLDVLKYLPPELTGKIYATVDLRTSFYQLGIMFYYIFTGRFPFESSIPEKLLYAQAFEKPTQPHVIKQEVPEWISAIIMKLLEKKPDDRYQTATAICFDLENFNSETKFIPGAKDCGHFKLTGKLFGYHAQLEELTWYNKHISLAETRVVFMKYEDGCGKKAFLENVNEMVNKAGGYYFNIDFSPVSGKFPFHGILILLNQIITRIKNEDKDSKFIDFLKSEKDVKAYLQQFATFYYRI
jgi:serine/threonine protein kinase